MVSSWAIQAARNQRHGCNTRSLPGCSWVLIRRWTTSVRLSRNRRPSSSLSHVEAEQDHIAISHSVVFAFRAHDAGVAGGGFGAVLIEGGKAMVSARMKPRSKSVWI